MTKFIIFYKCFIQIFNICSVYFSVKTKIHLFLVLCFLLSKYSMCSSEVIYGVSMGRETRKRHKEHTDTKRI